jgi:hypothetical protein
MMKGMPDTENVGIMQGFMDRMMGDDYDDEEEGDDEDEAMPERRPDSPEILMNNLRGDMRSIDARRDELADLVGYSAAADTPEPVLAMLQPVLAQQGGLGGLPQSAPMAQGPQAPMPPPPPPGPSPMGAGLGAMPPEGAMGLPPAPPGPPPGMPPVGMAKGGLVQRFQAGSDEDGVTPADEETPSAEAAPSRFYDPEVLAALRQRISSTLGAKPLPVPDVRTLYEQKIPAYRELMGDTRNTAQAQMLFDIAQRAFGYAANVDERGQPMRGSAISRLAGAFQGLPAAIGARAAEVEKGERAIKASALSAAEKEVENIKRMNQQIEMSREKLIGQLSGQAVKETADERRERLTREAMDARSRLATTREEGLNLRANLRAAVQEREGAADRVARARDLETRLAGQLEQAQATTQSREGIAQRQIEARAALAEAERNLRTALSDTRIGSEERMQAERLKQAAELQVQRLDAQMSQVQATTQSREAVARQQIEARAALAEAERNLRTALSDARIGSQERMQAERLKQAAEAQVQRLDAQMAQITTTIEGRKALEEQRITARAELEAADRALQEKLAAERNLTSRLNVLDRNQTMLQIQAERAQALMTPGFGRGVTGATLNIFTSMAPGYGANTLGADQDRVFETAVSNYITANRRVGTDALGNSYEQYPTLPPFVVTALRARGQTDLIPKQQQQEAPPPGAAPVTTPAAPGAAPTAAAAPTAPAAPPGPPRPPLDTRPIVLTPEERPYTFFNVAGKGTGIVPVTASFVAKFPLLGDLAPGEQQATSFLRAGVNQLTRSLAVGDRFNSDERKQILGDLQLLPQLIDNPESYRNRLMGLDALLQAVENRARRSYEDATLPRAALQKAARDYNEARQIRSLLGTADLPRIDQTPEGQSTFNALPLNSWFVFNSRNGPVLRQKTR